MSVHPSDIMPKSQRIRTQPFVVVGCVIAHEGKYLLVQEGEHAGKGYKTWNQPAGWLDLGERIAEGALREGIEETGLKLELKGFLGVYTLVMPRSDGSLQHAIKFIFLVTPLSFEPTFDGVEILDAQWFTLEQIRKLDSEGKLRDPDILREIEDAAAGVSYPLSAAERFTSN